jgi:hypothetical protein
MSAERQDSAAEEEAGALRRALVRFLMESSFEGSREAQVADELLAAVRGLPGQNADLLSRLERRAEKLEAQVTRLAEQVGELSGQARSVPDAIGRVSRELQGLTKDVARREEGAEKLRKLATDTLQDALKAVSSLESMAAEASRARTAPPGELRPSPAVPGSVTRIIPARRERSSGGVMASVITGVIASLLTTILLVKVFPGNGGLQSGSAVTEADTARVAARQPDVDPYPTPPPPVASASSTSSVSVAPPQVAPAAVTPWQPLWERALQQPISSCPEGAAATLRRCVCPGKPQSEECTLAAAQSSAGRSVWTLQAVLKAHEPPLLDGKVDGSLGKGTFSALSKIGRGCGPQVMGAIKKLKQEWQAGRSQSIDAQINTLLIALAGESSQCLEAHADASS